MPDIRNPVVLVAPTSHLAELEPSPAGAAASLKFCLWGGDTNAWSTAVVVTIATTKAAIAALGAAIASLLAGTAGPIVSGAFTVANATFAGRASIGVTWSGTTYYLDNAPGGYQPASPVQTYAQLIARELSELPTRSP